MNSLKSESPEILYREVTIRNPFRVETLPVLSRLHAMAFLPRRRLSKRFIGKPAKRLFRLLLTLGMGGHGRFALSMSGQERKATYNARNTQFGALYQAQNLPLYEPETSTLIDLLLVGGKGFVDVGANWGWYSLLAASHPKFSGMIHAFEPFPPTFDDLRRVVDEAGLDGRIVCHDVALADRDGRSTMALSDGVQSGLARLDQDGGVTITLATLDSLDVSAPDVLKIDAEDHELDVLVGSSQTLERYRPFIIFENWLHRNQPDLTLSPFNWLSARGYCFFHAGWVAGAPEFIVPDLVMDKDGRATLAVLPLLPAQRFHLPSQMNVLAVPVERLADLKHRISGE